jgi:leucine dehydrogenase
MVGTQLDPVAFTIDGLILALNQTIQMQFDKKSVDGFSFAIQGAGKIGEHLLRAVYPKAKKVYITDINLKKLSQLKKEFPNIEVVGIDDIYSVAADFFSPCAVSHSLNKRTIKQLKCKVILGGANIQLDNAEIGVQLHKMGILYIPDYVANAGGLISVTDEYEHGKASQKRIQEKLLIIPKRVKQIIGKSRITHTSTSEVADEMAEKIIARFSTKKSSKKVS